MKTSLIVPALALALLLGGCESLSDAASSMREKISAREEPHTQVFKADSRATYEAVKQAAEGMGYRYVRGGPAQGQFDAISGLAMDGSLSESRQISMKVRLKSTLEGGTELSVTLDEIVESDSRGHPGQGLAAPLKDTPQYDVFLRRVQLGLGEAKTP
jgi:hypothetical protein